MTVRLTDRHFKLSVSFADLRKRKKYENGVSQYLQIDTQTDCNLITKTEFKRNESLLNHCRAKLIKLFGDKLECLSPLKTSILV